MYQFNNREFHSIDFNHLIFFLSCSLLTSLINQFDYGNVILEFFAGFDHVIQQLIQIFTTHSRHVCMERDKKYTYVDEAEFFLPIQN